MLNSKFDAWCDAATAKIRYGGDRNAVSAELRGHLEDRYDAYVAQGLSFEEATAKALESMGSAAEIAPQLGKIHRPWLGWLYRVVWFVGITTTALSVLTVGLYLWASIDHLRPDSSQYLPSLLDNVSYYCEPELSAYVEGYYFHITEAAVAEDEAEGDTKLHLQIEIHKLPWLAWTSALNDFWAVDSLGNYYYPKSLSAYGQRRITAGGYFQSREEYSITIVLTQFDTNAQWVELQYDRDGRNIVFHIDLTGGDACE